MSGPAIEITKSGLTAAHSSTKPASVYVDSAGCRTAKGNRDQTLQKARRDSLFEGRAQQQSPGTRAWFGIHRGGQIHQVLVGELPCGGFQALLFGSERKG